MQFTYDWLDKEEIFDDDLEVEEGVLDLLLEIVVLDGGEHAEAETQEDDHKAVRTQRKQCISYWKFSIETPWKILNLHE